MADSARGASDSAVNKANSRWGLTDGLSEADIPSGEEQQGGRGGSTVTRAGARRYREGHSGWREGARQSIQEGGRDPWT